MLSSDQIRFIGEAVFFGLLAEPFFHSATDSLMHREYLRAIVGYLIGTVPATAGLIELGILNIGPFTSASIGRWIHPVVADPRWWLALWFFLLLWQGGSRFIERIKAAIGLPKPETVATVASRRVAEATKLEEEITDIVDQTFQNQEVLLDGYQYIGCTFINVTFVYNNGPTGGFDSSCKWTGSVGFKSRDERIQRLLGFLKSLRIIRSEAEGRYAPIVAPVASPTDAFVPVIDSSGEDALQLRFKQIAPYVQAVHPGTVYRIGLYNPTGRVIRNVQVSLWKVEPTPRELIGATDLPYPVTRPITGQFDVPNFAPCDINPKDEGFFELAHAWTTGPPDHRLILNHIATKGHKPWFEMHRDEMWRLYYRVSCADHRPIEFVAIVSPLNENILIQITETV